MTAAFDPRTALTWPQHFASVPKSVFHREDIYREELERIFYGPEWHPVAHVAEVPGKGDFKAFRLGERSLLVVRGHDDRVRVFYNSCTHRGTQLKTTSRGGCAEIECPYHRWLFSTEGELLSAPSADQFQPGFNKADYKLREIRSEERFGIVFATCSDATPPLDRYLSVVDEFVDRAINPPGGLRLLGYQKVRFKTNWKEYGDQEGYHAPLLHKAFRLLKWQGGRGRRCVNEFAHGAVEAHLVEVPETGLLQDRSLIQAKEAGVAPGSIVVQLFPLTIILKHLDVLTIRFALPSAQHEVEVHYAYFAKATDDEELARHRLRQACNLLGPSGFISLEDGAVFNRLHEGSTTEGVVEFQKGVGEPLTAPCFIGTNDECGNLVKWERYRSIMGFDRG